ncbi:Fructosamine kinase [Lichtheimia hyalospora FSU 10163]|nr:Fructosamine kinase [Lichtheimia hyalospora FSU 10163]
MFKSEAEGLKALDDTHTIRVPTPYAHGVLEGENCGYLATEYIAMGGKHTQDIQRKYGEQLADMHLAPGPDQFGFPVNNTIGSTPQDNTWTSDYLDFLYRRLKYQFDLASRHPQIKKAGQELLDRLPSYFEGLDPIRPSLQHGDLWSGNWSSDDHGNPVIFDPAPFYGHSESDLGIMQLFGGVNADFYKAYHSKIPKAPGFEKRLSIYTLYHAVNHLNMFGSSYLGTCMSLFSDILSD